MKRKKINLEPTTKKNFLWNITGVTLNSFNSLFFMIIVTRINGINHAGIFTFAFSTATLFNIIGVYSGRVYQVTDQSQASDKDFIASKILTCSLMLIVSLIFVLINQYNLYKSSIILLLCIIKMFEAFVETIYAILQKYNFLYKVGISLTIKSLASLIIFLILDLLTKNLIISVLGMLIIYIIIMIIYDYKSFKTTPYQKKDYKKEQVLTLLKKGFTTFLISFLILYLINSSKYVIDYLLTEDSQTIFGILLMPATVIILFTQFIIHPFLNNITTSIKDKNYQSLKKIISNFCLIMIILGIIVIAVAITIGIPVLELIYGLELTQYKLSFIVVMIGAVLYGIASILSNILIAMRHIKAQVIIYLTTSIVITIIEYFLINKYKIFGACCSYSIMTLIILVTFSLATNIYIRKDEQKK